jgi:hypothetical protein
MTSLGDLVLAVYDEAGRRCSNPADASRMAVKTLRLLLRGTRGAMRPLDMRVDSTPSIHPWKPARS